MTKLRAAAMSLLLLHPALVLWADEAPAPSPPTGVWIGKGQFGFLSSRGNSEAESVNGNVDMARYDGAWKNELYVGGLYGRSSGVVSAQRWETRTQSNYTVSAAPISQATDSVLLPRLRTFVVRVKVQFE